MTISQINIKTVIKSFKCILLLFWDFNVGTKIVNNIVYMANWFVCLIVYLIYSDDCYVSFNLLLGGYLFCTYREYWEQGSFSSGCLGVLECGRYANDMLISEIIECLIWKVYNFYYVCVTVRL